MYKFAIVDDEYMVLDKMEGCLKDVCKELQIEAKIEAFSSGKDMICALDKDGKNAYHILFLDIEMNNCNGIDVSRYLREQAENETTQIVYVSGKSEYDRQLFEFRPFGFIEKPIDTERLRECVSKYIRIYGKKQEIFDYKVGHGTYFISLSDVLYFESRGRRIRINTINGEVFFYGVMQDVIERVKENGFFLTHKSFLVNYRFVKCFYPDSLFLVNDERIPISKGKRNEVAKLQLHIENGGCL